MSANIINGKALAASLRESVKERAAELIANGITPTLTVIIVGDDPASQIYVRNKERACIECGMGSEVIRLPDDTTQQQLIDTVERLNADAGVHGILVQLPVPAHIDEMAVIESISPAKDVDGFTLHNAGSLLVGRSSLRPCTPRGCIALIDSTGESIEGKRAVVVGRSNIVGKPVALLLLERNATVSICHSRTADLAAELRGADIVVAAIGRPRAITGDMIKPGAIVIDVGINRLDDGKICGDVDFDSAAEVAGWITPVPGGAGPMTIAMLLDNTVEAAMRIHGLLA